MRANDEDGEKVAEGGGRMMMRMTMTLMKMTMLMMIMRKQDETAKVGQQDGGEERGRREGSRDGNWHSGLKTLPHPLDVSGFEWHKHSEATKHQTDSKRFEMQRSVSLSAGCLAPKA